MTGPSHLAIATAIIGELEDRVIDAWRYLDAWGSLVAAGLLVEDVRAALDVDPAVTEATAAIEDWQRYGARGLLVLAGARDSGKTYACAWWALARHEEGESTLWVRASSFGGQSLDELRGVMRRATKADALVFDDAGAGTMGHGDYFASMLEGLMLERGQRSTIISGNMNKSEMTRWLGPRITSRQKQAGSIVELEHEEGLRTRSGCVDPDGRGPRWYESRELVARIGCERERRWVSTPAFEAYLRDVKSGPDWHPWPADEPEGSYCDAWRVGSELVRASQRSAKPLREASKAFGLDADTIRARARELDATTGPGRLDLDARQKRAEINAKIGRIADNKRRSATCYKALAELTNRARAPKRRHSFGESLGSVLGPVAELEGGRGISKLKKLGFRVRECSTGFAVYHAQPYAKDGSKTKVRPALKSEGWPTKDAAWDAARDLL